jgi:ketosteroid isomerase-like protein
MKGFILIIFHLFLVVAASAQSATGKANRNTKTEQELLKANQEYDLALLRADAVALDRLYADEFVYTNPDGEIRDKAQQLALTRLGDLKFESAKSSDVKVRVYGKTAVMTGRFNAKGTFKGKNIDVRDDIQPFG